MRPEERSSGLVALALLALAMCSCTPRHEPRPQSFAPQPPAPPLSVAIAAFAPCVDALGPTRELPIVAVGPALDERDTYIGLSGPGIMMDGYAHYLHVQRATGLVYIVQRGGIIDVYTFYGPFDAEEGCLMLPARREPLFTDLTR